jgi:tungstate transport system substrate-binding protein
MNEICLFVYRITVSALIFSFGTAQASNDLRIASTTSTEATGLFSYLFPAFETQCHCKVSVIAVGTGKALKLGENGDVDLVFVHSRADEDKFVAQGFGIDRRDVMYNDFVLVGPRNDPAHIREAKAIGDVMKRIVETKQTFMSRGDESGTHKKELQLWKTASIQPQGSWYLSAGQGMSEVLMMASERAAYTLSDRSTYTVLEKTIDLDVLYSGDKALHNPYGVIAVNPARFPDINYSTTKQFIEWITSTTGQQLIANFKVNGQQLFFPSAKN